MPPTKRLFDAVIASFLLMILWPLIAILALLILLVDRHNPVFAAQRMRSVDRSFSMWKLRTMTGGDDGLPTGGGKAALITPLGGFLRHWHLDELPQLWNVLVGDMSLVGPRPPTRRMVNAYRQQFEQVLTLRPGVTGLGTVTMGVEEQRVMQSASSSQALERVYVNKILPCKLRIEEHYVTHRSFGLDLWLLLETARVILTRRNRESGDGRSKWDANVAGL